MIAGCGSQMRVGGLGSPFALDFGAVMTVGAARGADTALLAELLPYAERSILAGMSDESEPKGGDDDGQ